MGKRRAPKLNFSGISVDSFLGTTLRAPLRVLPGSVKMPILQGRLRGKWWIVGSSTHGCWLGSYEFDKQIAFERWLHPGDVVYDIGANAGYYTLLGSVLAGPHGHVVSFEPVAENLHYLYRHPELNRIRNVQVVEAAVLDREGEALFELGPNRSMGHVANTGSIGVRTVALDELWSSNHIPPPNVVKIDVEGSEPQVLLGAMALLRESRPVVLLATHGEESNERCCSILRSLGYEVNAMTGGPAEGNDELMARMPMHG